MSDVNSQASGTWEPQTTFTFLPRCPNCHAPHPRALKLDTDNCSQCDTFCPSGQTRTISATIVGFSPVALLSRFCLWLGNTLAQLARSIQNGR